MAEDILATERLKLPALIGFVKIFRVAEDILATERLKLIWDVIHLVIHGEWQRTFSRLSD